MSFTCVLGQTEALQDLKTYLNRALAIDPRTTIRVVAKPGMVAFYAGIIYPPTLLDRSATVLGMRAFQAQTSQDLDLAFSAKYLLQTLETAQGQQLELDPDEVTHSAPWLGLAPPLANWQPATPLPASRLKEQARLGMDAVAKALPDNPGHAVVEKVRSRIWSSPLEPGSNLPNGVAFVAAALGFLPEDFEGDLPVFTSGSWKRINFPGGFVLAKPA